MTKIMRKKVSIDFDRDVERVLDAAKERITFPDKKASYTALVNAACRAVYDMPKEMAMDVNIVLLNHYARLKQLRIELKEQFWHAENERKLANLSELYALLNDGAFIEDALYKQNVV